MIEWLPIEAQTHDKEYMHGYSDIYFCKTWISMKIISLPTIWRKLIEKFCDIFHVFIPKLIIISIIC